jgi:hypothetical protein
MAEVTFTPTRWPACVSGMSRPCARGKTSFMFEGNEFLVNYAKYLLEYLEGKFKP